MTEPDCNETLRELELFLDGELSETQLVAIRGHIEGCDQCLEVFDFHAELRTVIARKCRTDPMPPALLARIEQCFDSEP